MPDVTPFRRPGARRSASPARPSLDRLQRWMQALIVHPRPARVGMRSRGARGALPIAAADVESVIRPSPTLTALQRIDIYGGMYFVRMAEALAADFPVLKTTLGDDAFQALCNRYVSAHPSRHPNLNHLGEHLPAFVARQRGLERRPLLGDLVRLEWAIAESFNAPRQSPLDAAGIAAVAPDRWAGARLIPADHLRLLVLRHPLNAWYRAAMDGRPPRPPAPRASWIAVYRKGDRVWRMDLTQPMFALLRALCAGRPLGSALARRGVAPEAVTRWFREWVADGLFVGVSCSP